MEKASSPLPSFPAASQFSNRELSIKNKVKADNILLNW
jgi:hypothetical protein